MPANETTQLKVLPREPGGSRATRRLRREGLVPGVIYGGGEEPVSFAVAARDLRIALASGGAVIDLTVEGSGSTPVVLKMLDRHPVNGETVHLDLLRVNLNVKIQSVVVLELEGVEDAPGVKEGGVLELVTRELNIEALPNEIPDTLTHHVGEMAIGDTLTLASITPPSGVELLDDPETVIASLTPPKLQLESDDEIEAETGRVGEDGEPAGAADAGSDDAAADGDGDSAE
ncbi:MAG TPA: 50S ribosomal protein L25 [Solirubrobacteraceae bacterium]|nr:50S ribosomal protein L25 [Solirubrobacteraceae bacterium]